MSSYMIRSIPEGLISRARAKAREAESHLDDVLIRFLETYAEHGHPQALGGRAVMNNRTAEQRRELGRTGAVKRWQGHVRKHVK